MYISKTLPQTLLHFSRQLAVQSDHHFIVFSICDARARASSSSRCRWDWTTRSKWYIFFIQQFIAFIVLHHELPIRFRQIYRQRQLQTKHQRHHYLRPLNGVRRDDDANVLAEPVHFVPFCWRTIQIAPGNSLDSCHCLPIFLICANKDDGMGDDANSPQNKLQNRFATMHSHNGQSKFYSAWLQREVDEMKFIYWFPFIFIKTHSAISATRVWCFARICTDFVFFVFFSPDAFMYSDSCTHCQGWSTSCRSGLSDAPTF